MYRIVFIFKVEFMDKIWKMKFWIIELKRKVFSNIFCKFLVDIFDDVFVSIDKLICNVCIVNFKC